MSFFICFRVVRDSRLLISKFQFFVFSVLVVTAMGVGNEIVEFVLQNYMPLVFSVDINDTWLDLISNGLGMLLGAALFTFLVYRT